MKRQLGPLGLSLAGLCGLLFSTATAEAQEFYRAGQISIAAERLFGIHYLHSEVDTPDPGSNIHNSTTVGLGWYGPVTPLHVPRAAIDGFIIDRLSLGGSIGFFTRAGDADTDGVLFSPRVGYAVPISRVFTFWPRGGFTYIGVDNGALFGLSAEAMFVATIRPDWSVLFGPTMDIMFVGNQGEHVDWNEFSLGLPTVGLMVTF